MDHDDTIEKHEVHEMNEEQSQDQDLHGYNLRENRERNFNKHIGKVNDGKDFVFTQHKDTANVVMAQMTDTKGIKQFGQAAVDALPKEYEQFERMKVFKRVDKFHLTRETKRRALRAINIIQQKKDVWLKGRTYADGSMQNIYDSSIEVSSPTVSMEALMTSLAIDAIEGGNVGIFDVPGTYLNADMPPNKFIVVKFEGEFAELM